MTVPPINEPEAGPPAPVPPAPVKPFHDPVVGQGRTYDMAHLNPLLLKVNSSLVETLPFLRIRVRFSNHCFTNKYAESRQLSGFPILYDHNSHARSFCLDRYALSKDLPGIIAQLESPKVWVHNTAEQRNWCYMLELQVGVSKYHIFFEVKRATGLSRQTHELEIFVESAYAIGKDERQPAMLGRSPIGVLVGKIYLGQPHYFPRK